MECETQRRKNKMKFTNTLLVIVIILLTWVGIEADILIQIADDAKIVCIQEDK